MLVSQGLSSVELVMSSSIRVMMAVTVLQLLQKEM
jgi:hypothetical protein